MKAPVDKASVVKTSQMRGDDGTDTALLRPQLSEARRYLRSFRWCKGIREGYFGCGLGGVVAAFLFRIRPAAGADEWLWVVTGDLPSAYFVTDDAPNPIAALSTYCDLMDEWANAVLKKKNLSKVYPVAARATAGNAKALRNRLVMLRKEIIPWLASGP